MTKEGFVIIRRRPSALRRGTDTGTDRPAHVFLSVRRFAPRIESLITS